MNKSKHPENDTEEFVSKTQLKKDAKALQDFGKSLVELNEKQVEQLPLTVLTKNAILDYKKQQGNIAKKRHLAFIGKCLRKDSAQEAMAFLEEEKFSQLRAVVPQQKVSEKSLIELLCEEGESKIQAIVEANPNVERQALRQLVRNVNNAKTPNKKTACEQKLKQFLQDYGIK